MFVDPTEKYPIDIFVNIPSVNFYGTNPSVELAMIKIQEKIASTKVSFSF